MYISELTKRTGVPGSTIREYEAWGLISPSRRLGNGYRVFSDLHEPQLRLVRLCFAEYINHRLRQETIRLLNCSAALDMEGLFRHIEVYGGLIEDELRLAYDAAETLRAFIGRRLSRTPEFSRAQAAELASVSVDAVRGWERNGLVGSGESYARLRLSRDDIERMKLIRLLLNTGYNITAIRAGLRTGDPEQGYALLIDPATREEWLIKRDRWVELLTSIKNNAQKMRTEAEKLQTLLLHTTF